MSAPSDRVLETLARQLGHALVARGWRVTTAESCTGGWVAKVITDVPGSSLWFDSGVVAYSNDAKAGLLAVSRELIDAHGAVSEPVARAMADGARQRTGVELAVAVSGIAGPGGGTADKPVGTVCFAWSSAQQTGSEQCLYLGERETIRRFSVAHVLEGLLAELSTHERAE